MQNISQWLNLPDRLKENYQFCVWRYEEVKGRQTKVPYDPNYIDKKACVDDSSTFSDFQTAVNAMRNGFSGIGVRIPEEASGDLVLGGIDIDHCIDEEGNPNKQAAEIMRTMQCYFELSPSQHGLRGFFLVNSSFVYDIQKYYIKNPKLKIEIYISGVSNRYVTVTGNIYRENFGDLEDRTGQLIDVLEKYMQRTVKTGKTQVGEKAANDGIPDDELITMALNARNGEKFRRLWEGDISEYGSASEADAALCSILAFWCGDDPERIDRLFRESDLMRDKWDARRGGSTYGEMTVAYAIDVRTDFYKPKKNDGSSSLQPSSSFEPFDPFESEPIRDLPAFPVECLPEALEEAVRAVAESIETPVDLPACQALAVIALCSQGLFEIQVKPDWTEPVNLYLLEVARPSERKSPTLKEMCRPVYEYMGVYNFIHADEIRESQSKIRILQSQVNNLEKAIANPARKKGRPKKASASTGFDDVVSSDPKNDITMEDLKEKQKELREAEESAQTEMVLLADDVTPESLSILMQEQKERLAIGSAEGGIFGTLAGRYNKETNLDLFLKSYSGEPYMSRRVGREAVSLKKPLITMMLAVQPVTIAKAMSNDEFRGRGLLARFLYSIPVSRVGRRRFDTESIGGRTQKYAALVNLILIARERGTGIITLTLKPDAADTVRIFYDEIERRLIDDLEDVEEWAGKLVGNTMRIAALLHIASDWYDTFGAETRVSDQMVRNAITIGRYFIEHAKAAFDMAGVTDKPEEKDAKYIFNRILHNKNTNNSNNFISGSELKQACQKFKRLKDMEPGLNELYRRGYIRLEKINSGKPGRPELRYYTNPEALERDN